MSSVPVRTATARLTVILVAAALPAACQSDGRETSNSQIASAQGGLGAPPQLDGTPAQPDDDTIIDDNAPRLPLTGAYAPADPQDVGASAAEKLALDEIYKREPQRSLVENVQRELQVVQGINYRFTVKMSGANSYRVVVYRPLQGDMQVSSFEKLS